MNKGSVRVQHIIWPWETRKWLELKSKMGEQIHSLVDMDSRISSMYIGKLRPRQITDLFNIYYSDEQYARDRISQEVIVEKFMPMLQKLIMDGPKTFRGFDARLLVPGKGSNIALSRPQIATIIACMWFGLFEYNYVSKGIVSADSFPIPTFVNVFSSQNIFALQCILNYFNRIYEYMNDEAHREEFAGGSIIIKRHVLKQKVNWELSDVLVSEICIGDSNVDDTSCKLHTAYAHEFIGGNLFERSITQEEVILLIRPECLAAVLFCARLDHNETVTVFGAEKMSGYLGYGSGVRYAGNYFDSTPKGLSKDETEIMTQMAVVFMDASSKTSAVSQYVGEFVRDLNKAYCGFTSVKFSKPCERISSGNWTYGFNGNNMQVKFLQQVLAASQANKSLVYHPFGRDFEEKITPFIDWIMRNQFTVGELYGLYMSLIEKCYTGPNSRLSDLDVIECLIESN